MTGQRHRLPTGGAIDRSAPLAFRFDGQSFTGYRGDTLASALVANGVRLVGRSFKYHRPRGFLSAGPEEPNGLVGLGRGAALEPNTKATTVELADGMTARSQNRWPTLAVDLQAVNQLGAPFLGAGFYYKTFMWPKALWERLYEPLIRRSAGLGRATRQPDPDTYAAENAFCDVLVIGGGPAGLAAALAAGRAGARVILAEQDFVLGGRLLSERLEIDGMPGAEWARAAAADLVAMPEVRLLPRTAVVGAYDGGSFAAVERIAETIAGRPRQRLIRIIARAAVLAAGASERPIAFGGNDRPGVMLAGAVRTYAGRFAALPGERFVVFTSGDDGWKTALDLAVAGAAVEAVVDARPDAPDAFVTAAARAGARVFLGGRVVGTGGLQSLRAVAVADARGREHRIMADCLAVSGGWNPALGLSTHLGHRPVWSEALAAHVPGDLPAGLQVAGAAAGRFSLAEALADGAAAGVRAAEAAGFSATRERYRASDDAAGITPLWRVEKSRGKAFVDQQNDVTASDIALAVQEGFSAPEHLKRYTTLGMATDQGRTSVAVGLGILAALTGRPLADLAPPSARPPDTPVAIGVLAGGHRGKHFRPTRRTSAHSVAASAGGSFIESGDWLRAQWFAKPGEADWLATVSREVAMVRSAVGVCDVSTLGKIDVQGADAGAFLDRVYSNAMSSLPVGKLRYGLMLREDGFVMDDGTAARLADERFFVSTTTANAGKVMQHMEFCRQVLWPDLDVQLASVSEHWAQFSVAGPRSRETLQAVFGDDADLSDAAMPYLAARELVWRGVPARLYRLSFSGERAFEVAVPANFGAALAEALLAAAREEGGGFYGTEALGVMRIEKGHVGGAEINGQTTAGDLGLGRMLSTKKDFVGRAMAARPGLTDPDRPALVGVKPVDSGARLRAGAHFLGIGAEATTANDEGYLTSAAFSPGLGHWIGLGLLRGGAGRTGERVRAFDPVRNGDVEVEVVAPAFIDPEGARLHG